ncbi:hypothetical protein NDN08_001190 [Rhodosorus marinus]|uniref:Cilia- and flagella-associated protein 43 n=1 Tax=Rhodosorus marinus TaxID=101924 RepID=A0AAV8UUA7_9RHOD|nr:hypothetical protein NDN08_001190 [Rhodosorus marinus]
MNKPKSVSSKKSKDLKKGKADSETKAPAQKSDVPDTGEIEPASKVELERMAETSFSEEEDAEASIEQLAETAAAAMGMASDYTNKAGTFFSSMFQSAAKSVENTYEKAKHEIRPEALKKSLQHPQQLFSITNQRESRTDGLAGDPPDKTREILSISTTQVPLAVCLEPASRLVFVVSEEGIQAFDKNGTQTQEILFTGEKLESAAGAFLAVSAFHSASRSEIFVGCSDEIIRCYSLGQDADIGVLKRQTSKTGQSENKSIPAQVRANSNNEILVGLADGTIRFYNLETLEYVKEVSKPEVCSIGSDPVSLSSISPALKNAYVSYSDGVIASLDIERSKWVGSSVVHSGAASDTECVLDRLLLISSSTASQTLVIASPENGKCLCRQDIGYKVSALNRVEIASKSKESLPDSTVIVGGDGGEIAICRVLPFSPDRAGIRVLVELSTRSRWSEPAIAALSYEQTLGVVLAGFDDGTIKLWRLSEEDRREASSWREEGVSISLDDAKTALDQKNTRRPASTRISASEFVVQTQKVMSMVVRDEVGLDEDQKDEIVEEFQRLQAEAQEAAAKYDSEFEKREERIQKQFCSALSPNADSELSHWGKQITKIGKQSALLEYVSAQNEHSTRIKTLCASVMETFGEFMLEYLDMVPESDAATAAIESCSGLTGAVRA